MDVKKLTYEIVKDLLPEVGEGTSKTYPFIKTHDDLELSGDSIWGTVVYNFNTPSDLYYDVVISYDNNPKYSYKEKPYEPGDPTINSATIDFTADGGYEATNRQELFQIMATITKILKQEFNRPEVKENLDQIDYIPAVGKGRGNRPGEEIKKGALQRDELYLAFIKKAVPVKKIEYSPKEGNKTKIYLKESYKGKRTKDGAPGTFKAKITKAYGGDVTIEKARKFKNRKNATPHDKRQANWFINFHSKNENLDPSDLTGTGKAAPYGSEYKRLKEEEGFDRVDFYTGFLTSVTPSTFKVERKEDTIIVSNIYAPYSENFDEEDIKQVPVEQQMEELLMPHIVSLTGYMVENGLAIDDAPEIHFVDDPDNAEDIFGRTAYYDPSEKSITLYITGRHPKDILRSFAHEMIHYYQDYENRLHQTYTTDINEDDRLMELEREAYEKGNMYFRSWENNLKPGKV
jgi:hypothetical protein